ncbi:hypothetical protein SAMN02745136_03107 [Anaerocolumna jejuensis DSM 15929]|uniref:Uncharacterized protein n=1 Tax=Anaerocolumna jejuensis DSM 15929 TaxID=1121322 RepID=A0A1M6UJ65_9FIRM|nr:hypothetical protein [Anaerocolumna jejuensis]SHK69148.1 hypothetical protein SAMN02745136_03107 [Anaerocolumna jejuensis DSM 15929]
MGKSDKELAVELVIAQIQATSVIKHAGHVLKSETVTNLITTYYNALHSLDDN